VHTITANGEFTVGNFTIRVARGRMKCVLELALARFSNEKHPEIVKAPITINSVIVD
jgi:hypothetical protein